MVRPVPATGWRRQVKAVEEKNQQGVRMANVELKQLLESGVHFGHQTSRWNPKMRRYIFAQRGGIHIIDLMKTKDLLEAAQQKAREVTLAGDRVLFVCT